MAIQARWSGECSECGEWWQPGDLIRAGDDLSPSGMATWVHAHCPDAPPEREHPVCQTCWLTHPEGACDR